MPGDDSNDSEQIKLIATIAGSVIAFVGLIFIALRWARDTRNRLAINFTVAELFDFDVHTEAMDIHKEIIIVIVNKAIVTKYIEIPELELSAGLLKKNHHVVVSHWVSNYEYKTELKPGQATKATLLMKGVFTKKDKDRVKSNKSYNKFRVIVRDSMGKRHKSKWDQTDFFVNDKTKWIHVKTEHKEK